MIKLEYIWIDGTEPTPHLRSKTKVVETFIKSIDDVPEWVLDSIDTMLETTLTLEKE